jgi:hypothetical protein
MRVDVPLKIPGRLLDLPKMVSQHLLLVALACSCWIQQNTNQSIKPPGRIIEHMNTTIDVKADAEQQVADLAWEYCEKTRRGEKVEMRDYLRKCPDHASQETFKELVNTDLLLDLLVQEPGKV